MEIIIILAVAIFFYWLYTILRSNLDSVRLTSISRDLISWSEANGIDSASLKYNLIKDFTISRRSNGTFIVVGVGFLKVKNTRVGFAIEIYPSGGIQHAEVFLPASIALESRTAVHESRLTGMPVIDILVRLAESARVATSQDSNPALETKLEIDWDELHSALRQKVGIFLKAYFFPQDLLNNDILDFAKTAGITYLNQPLRNRFIIGLLCCDILCFQNIAFRYRGYNDDRFFSLLKGSLVDGLLSYEETDQYKVKFSDIVVNDQEFDLIVSRKNMNMTFQQLESAAVKLIPLLIVLVKLRSVAYRKWIDECAERNARMPPAFFVDWVEEKESGFYYRILSNVGQLRHIHLPEYAGLHK